MGTLAIGHTIRMIRMKQTTDTQGYIHHRERQRERILTHAERLFLREGIHHVSISEIADAANVTRATIYRYFVNRLAIAWEIMQRYQAEMQATLPRSVWDTQLLAAERLAQWLHATKTNFFLFPTYIAYRRQFEEYYLHEMQAVQHHHHPYRTNENHQLLFQILDAGRRDGSLVLMHDVMHVHTTLITMIMGFEHYLIMNQLVGVSDVGVDKQHYYTNFCQVIMQGLVKQ